MLVEPRELPPDRTILIFDGTCDFCTACAAGLRRLDRGRRLYIVPFQWEWARTQVGLTLPDVEAAAWAILPTGERRRGAAAINAALDIVLGTCVCSKMYNHPPTRRLQDRMYEWIARQRRRFPGVTPAIEQIPPWRPER